MDISINSKIICSDGPFGKSECVILKPTTEEITHLVVSDVAFPEIEFLVAISHVVSSTPDQIQLNCTREELKKMPVFNKTEFVSSDLTGYSGSPYMMWPYYVPMTPLIMPDKDVVPTGELAIRRGASVEATDGHVGHVDEFLIEPTSDRISHLVLREGHLWGQKDITIPLNKIDHFKDNTVYLKLKKEDIDKLPGIPIRHSWAKVKKDS